MRHKKYNPKVLIITGIILFIVISVVVINAQDMKTISRVQVSNKDIVISHGDTDLSNADVGFGNVGSLNTHDTNFDNRGEFGSVGGNFNNSGNFNNQNTNFENQGNFGNTGGSFGHTQNHVGNVGGFGNAGADFGNGGADFNNTGANFDNAGTGFGNENVGYDNTNGDFANYNVGFSNKDYRTQSNRYKYQNIDWGTWKSNFVNRILDDSMYIRSLDLYGMGTWFYYSFIVTDEGEIKSVNVFSFYLKEEDKKQVREMIRGYAYQPITVFPKDSKRKKAKVKAIMLLGGNTESKSNASNFRDVEKIKIQY